MDTKIDRETFDKMTVSMLVSEYTLLAYNSMKSLDLVDQISVANKNFNKEASRSNYLASQYDELQKQCNRYIDKIDRLNSIIKSLEKKLNKKNKKEQQT